MSRYFETLKRLRADASGTVSEGEPSIGTGGQESEVGSYPFSQLTVQSAQVRRALLGLLESLRLAALSTVSRSVVLTAVSSQQASRHVMAGLESVAGPGGLEMVSGQLTVADGSKTIELRSVRDQGSADDASTVVIDLAGSLQPESLLGRIEQVNPRVEVAVLHAPPLAHSVDAAVLARATAGLVLIFEPLITPRSDLFLALDRAESSGSRALGVVTLGGDAKGPRRLRRLLQRVGR